jgi:glycine cleavage system H protein
MTVPEELRYTSSHEWIRPGEGTLRVGITDYAQDALGDIVFVTLPEPGTAVEAGQPMGEVESTKTVSEIYAPASGTVSARNADLADHAEVINSDPYGRGWLVEIEPAGSVSLDDLLDAEAYEELIAGH